MKLRVLSVRAAERPVRLRLPFRFGDVTVRETAEAYLAVEVETSAGVARGMAAQLMAPRWFDKRPEMSAEATVEELRDSLRAAMRAAAGPAPARTVAAAAAEIRAEAVTRQVARGVPALAAGFGPALVEAALIDAACRAAGLSFFAAARADLFDLAALAPPDLGRAALSAHLAGLAPSWEIALRHTVGADAPLRGAEVADRPDALPASLDEVVAATGCRWFKIKLKGDPDADLARLRAVAAVLDAVAPGYGATLDANEQYDPARFAAFLDGLARDRALARLRAATVFVEQPFAREIALATPAPTGEGVPPLVIDEADDSDDAFPRALALGWAGTSVKSCKGVLRALVNAARAASAREAGRAAFVSAEDLTCQPGLCWQQDTLMAAAAGARHVERNGHHFAGGMQGAGAAEKARFLEAHPDLYAPGPSGPLLRVSGGVARFGSLDSSGFGSAARPDISGDTPIGF